MATIHRRCRELVLLAAALACVVVSGACVGDGESSAEGDVDGLAADADSAGQTVGVEDVLPGADEVDPGVDVGLEGDEAVEGGDAVGFEEEEFVEDVTPEPLLPVRIPAGTRISAAPDEDISTAAYRVDDPVIVTVTHDVLGQNGEFLLPRGVRLLGRVRTSMGSGGPGEAAVLEIDFETLSTDRFERPIEGVVVNRPLILDPVAARRRRSASSRVAAVTVVPGMIMAGTIIAVELRAPVYVPRFVAEGGPPWWSDSIPGVDSVVRRDTMPPRLPTDSYSRNPSAIPPRRGSDHPASDPSAITMINCTSPDIPPVK